MLSAGVNGWVRRGSRIISLFGMLAALAPCSVVAATSSVNLAWDASNDPNVAGYRVYYGGSSQTYSVSVDVGPATTAKVSGLTNGTTYYYRVCAIDKAGKISTGATAKAKPQGGPL